MSDETLATAADPAEFLAELLDAGLLIKSGVDGVYGHGEAFEFVRERLTAIVSEIAKSHGGAARLSFPPVVSRRTLETNGYVGDFPHLAGSIFGFEGSESEAAEQGVRAAAHEDWSEFQSQTDLMMLPAGSYPVYPALADRGPLDPGGVTVDIGASWVFRHEPSIDPARPQSFRMHEVVRAGEPEAVEAWRLEWSKLGVELFTELGLDGRLDQGAEEPKRELLVPITGGEPTACASFDYHLDHFGQIWDLKLSDGRPAHTACAAFGQDRIVLALLRTHGLDPNKWPTDARLRLWG